MSLPISLPEPVVITGVGMIASTGRDRESVWRAVREGQSGVKHLQGVPGLPDGEYLGAPVDIELSDPNRLKVFSLYETAGDEALADAGVCWEEVDRTRFGCSISTHMGDTSWCERRADADREPWWEQWFPNTACGELARRYGLGGPQLCYSTACASSLISIISAVRAIQDQQCEIALAGGAEVIHPLFAAGFRNMKVLAHSDPPEQACRPFDLNRQGFVMGEGGAMLVVERLGHALRRNARIYAAFGACKMLGEAHHVTGIGGDGEGLAHLISSTIEQTGLEPRDIGYINAHGTGTQQNDAAELLGIRKAFGAAADQVCVSSTKAMLGHMVNAAGAVELAITALALRDGFAPPTRNLTDPDPIGRIDCLPQVGRQRRIQNALKLSVAFGGHLAAVALHRWNDAHNGFAYPDLQRKAAA